MHYNAFDSKLNKHIVQEVTARLWGILSMDSTVSQYNTL